MAELDTRFIEQRILELLDSSESCTIHDLADDLASYGVRFQDVLNTLQSLLQDGQIDTLTHSSRNRVTNY